MNHGGGGEGCGVQIAFEPPSSRPLITPIDAADPSMRGHKFRPHLKTAPESDTTGRKERLL